MRKLRLVWASLALVAMSLAACSALFTAWTWRQTRDLSQSFKILQDRLEQVGIKEKQTKQTCRQTLQSTSTLALSVSYATILWLRLRESSRGVGYMENARLFHIYLLHAVSLLGSPLGAFIANQ